jgi:pimeloyl-ACP methyl ester carboxylesterase
MESVADGPEDGEDLVVVLGWGNRLHHENVQWLFDQFTDAGYRVHAFEIPDVIEDFHDDYVAPVLAVTDDLDSFRLVGHSTGGLIAAYIDGAETTTYLSPWWDFLRGQVGLDDAVLSGIVRIPTATPVVPSGTSTRDAIGELATDRQLAEGPTRAAPSFLREVREAQRERPPVAEDAVVFCSLSDNVVGIRAIGEAVPAERTVIYDGGHELFSSPSRADHIDRLLAVVADGTAALSDRG